MTNEDHRTVSLLAIAVAIGALCLALAGLFVLRDDAAEGSTGAAPPVIAVTLSELKIEPTMLQMEPGAATIEVTNAGSMVHNLEIPELDAASGDIAPGASARLELRGVRAGVYQILCSVPGHAAGGMTGMLHVGDAGDGSAGAPTTMNAEQMDAAMEAVAKAFPATTAGHGGDVLAPKVLPDGTKEFDLVTKVVDWEVAPGKTVKAWTYNGMVPGPTIKVDVGDKVRVVVSNELPESTTVHFHGVRVPNSMDGVDPYTQTPIKNGETFTYEFTALEPAVGMYHSHHNAQIQVPNGLAGAFLIGDMPVPASLAGAKVVETVNMVLNDAGTIGLSLNGKSFPATEPYKLKVGESMVVNYFNEGLQVHPMHLHQPKGYLIAKDGIPLADPIPGDTFVVAPGERATVLYTATDPGVWAWHCHILNHAEGPEGMFGMVTALIVE